MISDHPKILNGNDVGTSLYSHLEALFPICRSLTGEGTRETLRYFAARLPGFQIHEIPTGTPVFDWSIPAEWNIRDAWVADRNGKKVIDFQRNNLHVVGYSMPVDGEFTLEELQPHLYSRADLPEAIPYVTSYYAPLWGFCLAHRDRELLTDGPFHVKIDSELKAGSLSFGELIIPGGVSSEILLSTYVCHPSMANNELSGPVIVAALAEWLQALPRRRLTYRIIFIPETIGAIAYLSRHLEAMKTHTVAGFVVTCCGDTRAWSLMPSRLGETLADRVARHVLKTSVPDFRTFSFLERGSDERQYCSPGVDLPVVSIMRSKYATYPEYHTSLDNLDLVSAQGLSETLTVYQECLQMLEANLTYTNLSTCEPQMSRRNLYPAIGARGTGQSVKNMMNFLMYADGNTDLIGIAERIGCTAKESIAIAAILKDAGLLQETRLQTAVRKLQ